MGMRLRGLVGGARGRERGDAKICYLAGGCDPWRMSFEIMIVFQGHSPAGTTVTDSVIK